MLTFLNPKYKEKDRWQTSADNRMLVGWWNGSGYGGWTFYPGAASYAYRTGLEWIREEMRDREPAPGPYTRVVTTEHQGSEWIWRTNSCYLPGDAGYNPNQMVVVRSWELWPPSNWGPIVPAAAPSSGWGGDLTAKAFEAVRRGDPAAASMQMLPFVGELAETVRMIRNPVSFLRRVVHNSVRKHGMKGTRRLTLGKALRLQGVTATSGGFLAYTYGWKPLVKDLQSLGETFGKFSDDYDEYLRHQAMPEAERPQRRYSAFETQETRTVTRWYTWFDVAISRIEKAVCMLWGRFLPAPETRSKAAFLREKLGLNPRYLALTAWELIPLSFVIDWFIPVGDVLSKISALPVHFQVVKTQYTYTTEENHVATSMYYPNQPDGKKNPYWYGQEVARASYKFYCKQGSPILQDLSWSLNPNALAALALIHQFCAGRIK